MPPLLATTASEGINALTSTPSILTNLHTNILAIRSVLDKLDCIFIPSHPHSPIIHVQVRLPSDPVVTGNGLLSPDAASSSATSKRTPNPASLSPRPHHFDIPPTQH